MNSVDKTFVIAVKQGSNLPPSNLLCERPGCCHSTSKTNVRDRIFKLSPIHASVIIRFAEFTESSATFRKNSNISNANVRVKVKVNSLWICNMCPFQPNLREYLV